MKYGLGWTKLLFGELVQRSLEKHARGGVEG